MNHHHHRKAFSSPVFPSVQQKASKEQSHRREEQRREDADVDDEENERRWSQPFSSAAIPSILALDQSLPHRRTPLSDHCKLIQHTSNHMGFPHGLRENRDGSPFHVSGLCASLKTGRTRARNQVWLL